MRQVRWSLWLSWPHCTPTVNAVKQGIGRCVVIRDGEQCIDHDVFDRATDAAHLGTHGIDGLRVGLPRSPTLRDHIARDPDEGLPRAGDERPPPLTERLPRGDHDVFGGWSLVPGNLLAHRLSSSCEKQTRVRHDHSTRRGTDDPRRQDRRSRRDLPRRIVSGERAARRIYLFH